MLASALLARVKDLACDERLPSRQAASFKLDLAHDLKAEGLALLQVAEEGGVVPGHAHWRRLCMWLADKQSSTRVAHCWMLT